MVTNDQHCVFCRIVADTRLCSLLAEDDEALAFVDIHPANDGHCLVIPKGHYPTVFDIPPEIFASVGRMTVRVAIAVRSAFRPPGVSLVQANGAAANQTVGHLHIHVLPRRADDGLLLNWPRTAEASPARIAELAERIRGHLATV